MRKPIIAGNWKMYKTRAEALELVNGLKRELTGVSSVDIVVCPPFTSLQAVKDILTGSNIELGAQNVHWEIKGAYTGEVSPVMLKDIGAKFVIIGHSERRTYFKETDEDINKKIKSCIKEGLLPIFCVGETLSERESNKTKEVIEKQVNSGLSNVSNIEMEKIVVAYEPVWAIGTGKTATPEQAEEVHKFIRDKIREKFGIEIAERIRIQYGGSVKPDNIKNLMDQGDIDGVLVGGASLEIDSFVKIVNGVRSCLGTRHECDLRF